MSAPAQQPLNRNDAVDRAAKILASRLITSVDPGAINALDYTPRRAEQESRSPIVGIGITNTEEEYELAVLSRVEETRFNIAKTLHYFELPSLPYKVFHVGDIGAAASPSIATMIQGGDSAQIYGKAAGTLACAVLQIASGNRLLLSCSHVIADCNSGQRNLTPIISPANSGNHVGVLHDFQFLDFGTGSSNSMDAAVCSPSHPSLPGLRSKGLLRGVQFIPPLNTEVEKEGAATGVTKGVLTIKKATLLVNLSAGAAVFENQYGITGVPSTLAKIGITSGAFASGGDSGALVTDLSNAPIGLLFAVSARLNQAYVNPIDPILNRFGISVI